MNFEILQYNTNKAWPVMATFLRDKQVLQADVIAIQEPWRNDLHDTTHHPASACYQLLYPKAGSAPPGVCMWISKQIDPTTWSCQTMMMMMMMMTFY